MPQVSLPPDACRAAAQLGRTVDGALDASRLTPGAYRLLSKLASGRAAAAVLADKLAVSRPTVTSTTDWLVARGFVNRDPDPEDGRRVAIEMTPEGLAALTEADELVAARLSDVLASLDPTLAVTVVTALEHLMGALNDFRSRRHAADRGLPSG